MQLSSFSAAVLGCALPFAVAAQSRPVSQLEHIVVTPARASQPRDAATGDVTVIGADELRASPGNSLAEILARRPGIEFADSGGPQTPTSVFLRGANANQTLVLVNGVRINSATSGAVNWNAFDPAVIERVEILRGAASSLYGSDAMGGVINIITTGKGSDRPLSAFANLGMGSRGTFKSSAGVSGARDGWDYSLSASLAHSDGFSTMTAPAHPDRDGYSQSALSATLGYEWQPGQHVGLTAYNGYSRAEVDSYDFHAEPAYALTRQQVYTLTSTNAVTDYWESVFRLGLNKDSAESREPGSSTQYGSLQRSYSWQNNLQLNDTNTLSLILERLEERSQGSPLYAGHKRDTNAVGLLYRGTFGPHHVQASARNDTISGYGNQATGSLAYDFELNPEWQVGIAASTGFKAPTFNDLYFPLSPPWFDYEGNPGLQPEKSRNIETHLRYENASGWISLTAYQNKVRNLINPYVCQEYFGAFCGRGRPENVDAATLRGVSLAGAYRWDNTTISASADFQDPRDNRTGNQLSRRARRIYGVQLEQQLDRWTFGTEYQHVGARYDDAGNLYRLGGYSLWNLSARYDFSKNLSVQARWKNVLNKDYVLARGYRTEGSTVFINLAWRM